MFGTGNMGMITTELVESKYNWNTVDMVVEFAK